MHLKPWLMLVFQSLVYFFLVKGVSTHAQKSTDPFKNHHHNIFFQAEWKITNIILKLLTWCLINWRINEFMILSYIPRRIKQYHMSSILQQWDSITIISRDEGIMTLQISNPVSSEWIWVHASLVRRNNADRFPIIRNFNLHGMLNWLIKCVF